MAPTPAPATALDAEAAALRLTPAELESEHVHKVYDSIAPHFSHTRHHPWPLVTDFLHALPDGALVADVGCGNGKYLGVNPRLLMIGADRSIPLLTCSGEDKDYELFGCDALNVPLRAGAFDAAISIAVLHHISTPERRVALISELARIVTVGGEIYIVAWAFEQDERSKRQFAQQDVLVEWKLQEKYAPNVDTSTSTNEGDDENQHRHQKDQHQPSKKSALITKHAKKNAEKKWVVYQRYCHVYRAGELEELVSQVPGLEVLSCEYSRSNWCLKLARVA